jgi:hypothetical protein
VFLSPCCACDVLLLLSSVLSILVCKSGIFVFGFALCLALCFVRASCVLCVALCGIFQVLARALLVFVSTVPLCIHIPYSCTHIIFCTRSWPDQLLQPIACAVRAEVMGRSHECARVQSISIKCRRIFFTFPAFLFVACSGGLLATCRHMR